MALTSRNLLVWGGMAAVIAGLVWVASQPETIPVDIVEVERGAIEVTVDVDGKTQIRDIFDVSAPVAGRLLRIPVSIGEEVSAGETVVARIEPSAPAFLDARSRQQAEAAVDQAFAAVELAEAAISMAELDLGYAERELLRVTGLFERGTIPQAQLETAELSVEMAKSQLDSAHAQHAMRISELAAQEALLIGPDSAETSEDETCCINLIAPISGRVLGVTNASTRMVMPGETLLSIGEMHDLEIEVELLSSDAVRLPAGATAYVERWGGDTLMAELREIDPAAFTKISALGIEEQRVRAHLDFAETLPEDTALGHGYRVYLRIIEWRGDDVLRLPISALFRQDGDWMVFTVSNGLAHITPVEIGHRNADFAEVLGGIGAGDLVITHPSDRVANGVMVIDRNMLE